MINHVLLVSNHVLDQLTLSIPARYYYQAMRYRQILPPKQYDGCNNKDFTSQKEEIREGTPFDDFCERTDFIGTNIWINEEDQSSYLPYIDTLNGMNNLSYLQSSLSLVMYSSYDHRSHSFDDFQEFLKSGITLGDGKAINCAWKCTDLKTDMNKSCISYHASNKSIILDSDKYGIVPLWYSFRNINDGDGDNLFIATSDYVMAILLGFSELSIATSGTSVIIDSHSSDIVAITRQTRLKRPKDLNLYIEALKSKLQQSINVSSSYVFQLDGMDLYSKLLYCIYDDLGHFHSERIRVIRREPMFANVEVDSAVLPSWLQGIWSYSKSSQHLIC